MLELIIEITKVGDNRYEGKLRKYPLIRSRGLTLPEVLERIGDKMEEYDMFAYEDF